VRDHAPRLFKVSKLDRWRLDYQRDLTDIEAKASGLGITLGSTSRRIVAVHYLVSKISVSATCTQEIRKGVEVSRRGRGSIGYGGNLGVGTKVAGR
jgi:hypothetical protein